MHAKPLSYAQTGNDVSYNSFADTTESSHRSISSVTRERQSTVSSCEPDHSDNYSTKEVTSSNHQDHKEQVVRTVFVIAFMSVNGMLGNDIV